MTDDLVERLIKLRSKQYADPNTGPEFVFLDPDLPPSEWQKQYGMDIVYVRGDLIEALEEQNKRLSKIIAALMPHLVEHYFICGEGGEKDDNGLPDAISICPAYGADWTVTYKRVKHENQTR
jgi:hypothetical protein